MISSAERRAHRHGERAQTHLTEGNRNRVDLVKDEEGERDHAHGLLGIVEAVAHRHEGGGNDLQLVKARVSLLRLARAHRSMIKHGQEAHAETGEGDRISGSRIFRQ